PARGGTACLCASSSRRGLDGRLLGELRFVEIRARLMMSRRGEHRKGYCNELPRACPVTNEASPVEYRVQRVGPESVWRRSFRPNDRTENQTAVNYVASIRRRADGTSLPASRQPISAFAILHAAE